MLFQKFSLYHYVKRACERAIPGHAAPVTALAMSADGSELVSGGGRGNGAGCTSSIQQLTHSLKAPGFNP